MVALDSLILQSICTASAVHFGTSKEPWKFQFIGSNFENEDNKGQQSRYNKIKQWIYISRT